MLDNLRSSGPHSLPLTGNFLAGRLRDSLSADDQQYVEDLIEATRSLNDRDQVVGQGEFPETCAILIEGFMFRTVTSEGRRSIVGVYVPGDFVDLHGFALKRLDHNAVSAGPTQIGIFSHAALNRAVQERPSIARALWYATLLDGAIHRKWLQVVQNLEAPRRIAHIYAEVQQRLAQIGRSSLGTLRTPFTQIDLADMCGISAVHANRAVSRLREAKVAEIRRGSLYTNDWEELRRYAKFDASYLYADTDALDPETS